MGAQKNQLIEMVYFEQPKHMLKLMGKKIITILCSIFFFLTGPYLKCDLYIMSGPVSCCM